MDEERFNMSLRKFLKKVGVTSQREIEGAVRAALADGRIAAGEGLRATMTLSVESVGLTTTIDGEIKTE